jgi:hypothetical protein
VALRNELKIGLKEWAVVCGAMGAGRQIILLRKGGIYEAGGEFEIEYREFVLFPTYLHQNVELVKESERAGLTAVKAEPARVGISLAAEITDIVRVESRAQMYVLDGQHIWTSKLIDMRFNYKPENPLYLLLLRAYRLAENVEIENTPAYAGCKSWVPLETVIETTGATAVLSDSEYRSRRESIFRLSNHVP